MPELSIVRLEGSRLTGKRPRLAGCNARLGPHGDTVRPAVCRLTLSDGSRGWGAGALTPATATAWLGRSWSECFDDDGLVPEALRPLEWALWDLRGQREGRPVWQLLGGAGEAWRARCYDTSLYMDELHLDDDVAACALMAGEVADGLARGHRHFKVKVGRAARHMKGGSGTRRDLAVIRAVRAAMGPTGELLLDANNGWNLNLAIRVLYETAGERIGWLEEPFHEDGVLYRELRTWLDDHGLPTLIADGEGEASPSLLRWAEERLIDVVQYDIFGRGLSGWVRLGRQLDAWGVVSAPHHYGGLLGNYYTGHLAAAVQRFGCVEWDQADEPRLDASAYRIEAGEVVLPASPGFGLALDESVWIDSEAWAISAGAAAR